MISERGKIVVTALTDSNREHPSPAQGQTLPSGNWIPSGPTSMARLAVHSLMAGDFQEEVAGKLSEKGKGMSQQKG